MFVSSLIIIVSSDFKLDGSICDRYSVNFGVFCPLINLTRFNREGNIAYISAMLLQTSTVHSYAPVEFEIARNDYN